MAAVTSLRSICLFAILYLFQCLQISADDGFVSFDASLQSSTPETLGFDNILEHTQKELGDWLISLRREFHKTPELMFKEYNTSSLIQQTLDKLGVSYKTGYAGGTGVVATIGNGEGPIVALRADMDALPILEEFESDFKSKTPGVMHACGHDAHMTMLLGAASLLKAHEKSLPGTVKLLFQPAEEGGAGGEKMVEEGALRGVEGVFAFHVWPTLPSGVIGSRSGVLLAATDRFSITVKGKGGHGAMPHLTIDPIIASAHIITSLQSLVSRETSPIESRVVTVGQIHGGNADNVIPEVVVLTGTFRSLTKEGLVFLRKRIKEVAEAQAIVSGCTAEVDFSQMISYPPTINSDGAFQFASDVVTRMFGKNALQNIQPSLAGEDFSFMLEAVSGCMLFLGIRNEAVNSIYGLHTPQFTLDEEVLPRGAALHFALALEFLKQRNKSVA